MELVWDAAMVTRVSGFVFQPATSVALPCICDEVNMYVSMFKTIVLLESQYSLLPVVFACS